MIWFFKVARDAWKAGIWLFQQIDLESFLFVLESAVPVKSEGQQLMFKLAGECKAYGKSFMNRTDDNDTDIYCPAYFDG